MTGNEKQNIVWELSQEHRLSSVGGQKWWKTAMIAFAACVGCWRGGGSRRMREGFHAVSRVVSQVRTGQDKPPHPHAGYPVDGWRWRWYWSPLFAFVVSDTLPVRSPPPSLPGGVDKITPRLLLRIMSRCSTCISYYRRLATLIFKNSQRNWDVTAHRHKRKHRKLSYSDTR